MAKARVPIVEGLFTLDDPPHLIGGRGKVRESYFFPKDLAGRDPMNSPEPTRKPGTTAGTATASNGSAGTEIIDDEIEEVLLSRVGKVWSFTSSNYAPPPPFVQTTEPWEPYVLAAVQLEKEKMVILGQMLPEVRLEDVKIGMEVELVLDVLYADDENEYLVWKWKPTGA